MSAKRSWTGRAAAAAMAVGLALATSAAVAAPAAEQVESMIVPSAKSLLRFYPTQLSSTPAGIVEDQDVWLAKVQGLMAGAPSLLQQSILMSQTKQEFSSNVALLQQMQKGVLEQSALNLRSQAKSGQMAPKLGFTGPSDLVYTALEPCRIMDTRNASGASGVQGPIAGGSLKHIPGFITAGTDWSQYGQIAPLSDCGLNSTVGNRIWAVAIVITIPAEGGRPNFDAFLGVSDINNLNTTLSHVALNFTHGQGISTLYIVPQIPGNTIYFAMPAGLSANIIFDVVGYFAINLATALECSNQTDSVVVSNGITGDIKTGSCAAGFTLTGGGCDWGAGTTGNLKTLDLSGERDTDGAWACTGTNNVGADRTLRATAYCCRVPGR